MNERRLRAIVDELELTVALLVYANTVDMEADEDDEPPRLPRPLPLRAKVIPLRRPSTPKPPKSAKSAK